MSEFVDHLKTNDLHVRKASRSRIKTEMTQMPKEIVEDFHLGILNGYEITTSYHQRFFCNPRDLEKMVGNAKKIIKEHLYGKFRLQLLELENAVLCQDLDEARVIIKDIMGEVFNV